MAPFRALLTTCGDVGHHGPGCDDTLKTMIFVFFTFALFWVFSKKLENGKNDHFLRFQKHPKSGHPFFMSATRSDQVIT